MTDTDANAISIDDGKIIKTILKEGEGDATPPNGSHVTVHYTGTLASDGSKFDSSVDRGQPFSFDLGQGRVIKGWDKGVATMKRGEKCILRCQPDYAYGERGSPPTIPPNSVLDFEVEMLDWEEKDTRTEVTDDRKVMIDVLEDGDWKSPVPGATVTVRIEGRLDSKDGKVFMPATEQKISLDDIKICDGLQAGLMKMGKGEHSILYVDPSYAYGEKGDDAQGIPPNTTLIFDITMIEYEKKKETHDMEEDSEKTEWALERKNVGNDYFKAGRFRGALERYDQVLDTLDDVNTDEAITLKLTALTNSCTVYFKKKDYSSVLSKANAALEIDSKNAKALFKKGQAEFQTGAYEEALASLKLASQDEKVAKQAKGYLAHAKKQVQKQVKKQRATFKNMFSKVEITTERDQPGKTEQPMISASESESEDEVEQGEEASPSAEDA